MYPRRSSVRTRPKGMIRSGRCLLIAFERDGEPKTAATGLLEARPPEPGATSFDNAL